MTEPERKNKIRHPLPHGLRANNPKRIVVHVMGEYLEMEDEDELVHAPRFLDRWGLSAHVLITPDSEEIRCREDIQGAYHAKGHNEDTLGVEVLCPNAKNLAILKKRTAEPWIGGGPFQALINRVWKWQKRWDILREEVVRHSDLDPERKWFDPGDGFPWDVFQSELRRKEQTA